MDRVWDITYFPKKQWKKSFIYRTKSENFAHSTKCRAIRKSANSQNLCHTIGSSLRRKLFTFLLDMSVQQILRFSPRQISTPLSDKKELNCRFLYELRAVLILSWQPRYIPSSSGRHQDGRSDGGGNADFRTPLRKDNLLLLSLNVDFSRVRLEVLLNEEMAPSKGRGCIDKNLRK
jgi:hypothetical protein